MHCVATTKSFSNLFKTWLVSKTFFCISWRQLKKILGSNQNLHYILKNLYIVMTKKNRPLVYPESNPHVKFFLSSILKEAQNYFLGENRNSHFIMNTVLHGHDNNACRRLWNWARVKFFRISWQQIKKCYFNFTSFRKLFKFSLKHYFYLHFLIYLDIRGLNTPCVFFLPI